MHEVFREGSLHVSEKKCSTCIFRPGNLMHLEPDRKDTMAASAVQEQSVIVCHKTISGEPVGPAVCRGYWDVHKQDVGALQVAERLDVVKEVDVDEKEL